VGCGLGVDGFGLWGSGLGVRGLGLGFRVESVDGSGCRLWYEGSRVWGLGRIASSFGGWVWRGLGFGGCLGSRVDLGFEFRFRVPKGAERARTEREFFIDNPLVRIHFIIVMIRWTGLAPWEFEFSFRGSLASAFLGHRHLLALPQSIWANQFFFFITLKPRVE